MTISVTETALDMEKKAIIGCCTRRNPLRSWLAWVCCLTFLISSSIFYIFWCTNSYREYVQSQIVLYNDSKNLEMWQNPSTKLLFKVYVFNYTNVNDYEAYRADRLRVEELGPYVYEETKSRVNVEVHENTVTYQEKKSYEWIGGRSDKDNVLVPNVPLMSSVAFVRDLGFAAQLGLTAVLSSFQERPFINVTSGGYIWGYPDSFFEAIKPFLKLNKDIHFENFGVLAVKTGVDPDRITMNTGVKGLGNIGMIESLNGLSKRYVWDDERCDKVEGTDGGMFPPRFLENPDETLDIYMKDICRKVPYHFSEYVTVYDIPMVPRYKFSIGAFNFSNTQNECFCRKVKGSRVCPPTGFFNFSTCSDSTLISSFPHFYAADTSQIEQIDGLNPQREKHESYMDLHPNIPISIHGWTRIQLNIEVRKAVGVPFFGRLKDGAILPLLWMEIGLDELPEAMVAELHRGYFTAIAVEAILQWCSLIAMILSLGALIVCFRKHRVEQLAAPHKSSGETKLLEMS